MAPTSSARLPALYAAVGAGIGTLLPYLVLYLTARGLTATGAGLVIGLMSGVGVVVIPLWGRLADGRLGLVRTLRLSLVLAAVAALALLAAGRTVPAIVVCALLLAAARAPRRGAVRRPHRRRPRATPPTTAGSGCGPASASRSRSVCGAGRWGTPASG